jgi:hypothetical protein
MWRRRFATGLRLAWEAFLAAQALASWPCKAKSWPQHEQLHLPAAIAVADVL